MLLVGIGTTAVHYRAGSSVIEPRYPDTGPYISLGDILGRFHTTSAALADSTAGSSHSELQWLQIATIEASDSRASVSASSFVSASKIPRYFEAVTVPTTLHFLIQTSLSKINKSNLVAGLDGKMRASSRSSGLC